MKKGLRKWVILCAAVIMIFASFTVDAKTTYKKGTKTRTYAGYYYKTYYEGALITDDTHPALKINGNIMVPYEYALVKNGPKVTASYNKSKGTLLLTLGSNQVKLYIGKKYIYVNNVKKKIATAPMKAKVNGTSYVMVPAKAVCEALNLNYSYVKKDKAVYISRKSEVAVETKVSSSVSSSNLKASTLKSMSIADFIKTLGPIAQADYKKTGVLASVTLAQAINESGWARSTLAQKSNNLFGMKISLSGNTWSGSTWDGKSYVTISTREQVKGKMVTVKAKFRKYDSVTKSISDHSAYLKNAKKGLVNRYAGLTSTTSYSRQLKILQTGGYCTWSGYVKELTAIIKKYNLTKYDVK